MFWYHEIYSLESPSSLKRMFGIKLRSEFLGNSKALKNLLESVDSALVEVADVSSA